MEKLLELDSMIRNAIVKRDGETVMRLCDRHTQAVQDALSVAGDGDVRRQIAAQISDLLARNIELAHKVQAGLRADLQTVMAQRKLIGSSSGSPAVCSYRA